MYMPVLSFVMSLIASLITGPYIIKKLRSFKLGQNVRLDGPESHLIKQGIPSMGGIIFLGTTSFFAVILSGLDLKVIFFVLVMLSFGFVGFLDDYLKVKKKSSDGLSAKHKMILLVLIGLLAASILYFALDYRGLRIPFTSIELYLGLLYIPFVVIFFAAVTNAVNLTDGIDGLSSSVTLVVLIFFILISLKEKNAETLLFTTTLAGGLLGFLYFNKYPAKVFMGDTGSLALGGAVGILSLGLRTELLLVLVGIIYVVETLSVIIQVTYFKKTKKRIFKMAPIHHHFEALGWKETKIVGIFSLVTAIMVFIVYFFY